MGELDIPHTRILCGGSSHRAARERAGGTGTRGLDALGTLSTMNRKLNAEVEAAPH